MIKWCTSVNTVGTPLLAKQTFQDTKTERTIAITR
jgi:hypothetical protein